MYSKSKKIGVIALIIVALIYIASKINFEIMEKNSITAIKDSNTLLMGQSMTINDLYISPYGDYTTIHDLTLSNPTGYVSPYAFSTTEIKIQSTIAYSSNNGNNANNKHVMMVNSARIKNAHINYDKGVGGEPNLYQIVRTLINNVNNYNKNQNKTPNDEALFFLNKLTIEKPIIVIYENQSLIKSIHSDDIVLRFDQLKQPTTYKMALAYGCEQLIRLIDPIVNKSK